MGVLASVQEDPPIKVWTLLLKKWGIKYDEWALLALLTWSEKHGLDVTERTTLDLKTWGWTGKFIIEAASIGNETAINVIKPWRLILDLLRQLNPRVT